MKNKKAYVSPEIELIKLDNEISLQLLSPYSGPQEGGPNLAPRAKSPESSTIQNDDPYNYEQW